MRRCGIRSAILTILNFERYNLISKEAVKQEHLTARKNQLEKANGKNVAVRRIISEDLELFYTSLENPAHQPKEEYVDIFLTKQLTEEELTLLENRNRDFLNTFWMYGPGMSCYNIDKDMKKIVRPNEIEAFSDTSSEASSEASIEASIDPDSVPESIFYHSIGVRDTTTLHVTLESIKEEMLNRVANEDLSDMELKRQSVEWYGRNLFTYKFVKKE